MVGCAHRGMAAQRPVAAPLLPDAPSHGHDVYTLAALLLVDETVVACLHGRPDVAKTGDPTEKAFKSKNDSSQLVMR